MEFDIALTRAARLRAMQHARRQIDAIDASVRSDGARQITEADAGAATDFERAVATTQAHMLDGAAAHIERQKQRTIE
jgi:hypothetical protein